MIVRGMENKDSFLLIPLPIIPLTHFSAQFIFPPFIPI